MRNAKNGSNGVMRFVYESLGEISALFRGLELLLEEFQIVLWLTIHGEHHFGCTSAGRGLQK